MSGTIDGPRRPVAGASAKSRSDSAATIRTAAIEADVIVVGAGPGGSATATHLARRGLDVALLEKSQFPREKVCGDGLIADTLGAWPSVLLVAAVVGAATYVLADSAPSRAFRTSVRLP